MAIVTRASKGSALTHTEMDNNFTELRDRPTGQVYPKTKGIGIKIDTDSPDWGWHDLLSTGFVDPTSPNQPEFKILRGGVKDFYFQEDDEMLARFHMPHDYVPGSDLYIHVHWCHELTTVNGGSVTFGFEHMYTKGHDQGSWTAPKTVTLAQNASTIQYQHLICETALSTSGGSSTQEATEDLEVDGLILCRFFFDSNDITVSSGLPPDGVFVHFVDIHYQSTGLPTKNKGPDFWT